MRSLERYPLPVTTEKDACALEGVGSFTARRMLRGLSSAAPTTSSSANMRSNSNNSRGPGQDEENVEPTRTSSSSSAAAGSARGRSKKPSSASRGRFSSTNPNENGSSSLLRMNLRADSGSRSHERGAAGAGPLGRPLSLASNFAALRGDVGDSGGGVQTPVDVTPKRPTSRARREEVGEGIGLGGFSSKAPRFFTGDWEAWLIVDNREHDFMSMQVKTDG